MSITITLTISLHDTDEATDRIIDNSEVRSKLQQISENQWQSWDSYDTEDWYEDDQLYELKENIAQTLSGLEYEILNNGEF